MRMLRAIGPEDGELLARASAACAHLDDAMSAEDIAQALQDGRSGGVAIEVDGTPRAMMTWTTGGDSAMISLLWRNGPENEAISDFNAMWQYATKQMRKRGVRRACGVIGVADTKIGKLLRLYGRYGMRPDVVRVSGSI